MELGSFVACHGNNGIPTPQAKFVECGTWLPQLRRQRHQGHINSFLVFYNFNFLLAFKRAVCQASNSPNAPNAFLAPPTPQAKTPKPPSKRSKRLFGTPNPPGKPTKATSIVFSWRSSLFARPQIRQTLQTHSASKVCGTWLPQPRKQRHKGPSNRFLLAFKPAVCQDAFLAPPTPQAKEAGPHQ